jgi:diguanylate cyclase (GGDEF)-like protein
MAVPSAAFAPPRPASAGSHTRGTQTVTRDTSGFFARLLRRHGLAGATVAVTAASVAASAAVTCAMMALFFGGVTRAAVILSVGVPAVLAPVFTFGQLRLIVQLQSAREELRHLSITDDLTGAFNRRHFVEIARREAARAAATGAPFAVVLMDLDGFKEINDRHGHAGGDHVIRAVSEACRDALPPDGVFARLGGEEFGALLPGAGPASARKTAETLRRVVSLAPIRWGGQAVRVTASLGVAAYAAAGCGVDALMLAADDALYAAKRNGKNRVEMAAECPAPAGRAAAG